MSEALAAPADCSGEPERDEVGAGELVVLKFGGTSVGNPRRIRRAAKRVRRHVRRGERVVVVVSAAGQSTDRILRWHRAVAPAAAPGSAVARELDRALATGEDLSAALLASALLALGVPAISVRGGEAGIEGVGPFGGGTIRRLAGGRLRELLERGVVPVVSGFQAALPDGETVTLGRGGSDTSAVFLAGALGAAGCHIVTDVDAVYDRDPRLHPDARRIDRISHEALVDLTEGGAQVVHPAAARFAGAFGTPLLVYSYAAPLSRPAGTLVATAAVLARHAAEARAAAVEGAA
ncbi:MAG TPA: hypothetical protein VFQ38_20865 [Longimicrobiales bacterium]|nr:hypothetical protein [Longimicrobiales bacterium]